MPDDPQFRVAAIPGRRPCRGPRLARAETQERVGRFMLQDLLGHTPRAARQNGLDAGRGYFERGDCRRLGLFSLSGRDDPLGGINSLWPLFGIANQLLSAIALCVATTVFLKMHRAKYLWVTAVPLLWLIAATFTAGVAEDFSPKPRLDFWRRHGCSKMPSPPARSPPAKWLYQYADFQQ